jgi:hypothetical protein
VKMGNIIISWSSGHTLACTELKCLLVTWLAARLPGPKRGYLAKHPDAFWVDFGDFSWHRMDGILGARLIGGFARAGSINGKGLHSSTFLLNSSCVCHQKTPCTP